MSDGWMDAAVDYCGPDYGRPRLSRLVIKLVIAYVILVAMYVTERQFRSHGTELEAKVEVVGRHPKQGTLVRYQFRDPATGSPRMNTVRVLNHAVPQGDTALIEYVAGEFPTSRLKVQARPGVTWFFFWVNTLLLSSLGGLIAYIAWEGNRPIPRSSERRNPRCKISERRSPGRRNP